MKRNSVTLPPSLKTNSLGFSDFEESEKTSPINYETFPTSGISPKEEFNMKIKHQRDLQVGKIIQEEENE